MLVQSKYMQHTEAVLKNPTLFGDYRNAKSVGRLTPTCSHYVCVHHCSMHFLHTANPQFV